MSCAPPQDNAIDFQQIMSISLKILSPESLLLEKEVERVELPGTLGRFVVLEDHAPIISALTKGRIVYDGGELGISSGFVEVRDNKVRACVEL